MRCRAQSSAAHEVERGDRGRDPERRETARDHLVPGHRVDAGRERVHERPVPGGRPRLVALGPGTLFGSFQACQKRTRGRPCESARVAAHGGEREGPVVRGVGADGAVDLLERPGRSARDVDDRLEPVRADEAKLGIEARPVVGGARGIRGSEAARPLERRDLVPEERDLDCAAPAAHGVVEGGRGVRAREDVRVDDRGLERARRRRCGRRLARSPTRAVTARNATRAPHTLDADSAHGGRGRSRHGSLDQPDGSIAQIERRAAGADDRRIRR